MVGLLSFMGPSLYKIKFSSTFFKRWQVSSGQRLLVAMSRLQLAWEIGYALRDPKLNCVQLPGLREKMAKAFALKAPSRA